MIESIQKKNHFGEDQIILLCKVSRRAASNRCRWNCRWLSTIILVTEDFAFKTRSYKAITGNFTFSTHNPDGEVLYGIDVFINPKYRGLRLGRRL
jgi:hypothetical protein